MVPATYTRYSSDNQRKASTHDQLRNNRAKCKALGWPDPLVYSDEAVSGSLMSREAYDRLLVDAEAGVFDALVVDDLSRLGRDMAEITRVIKLFKYWGIRVIGVSDGVDTERKGYKVEVGLRGLMGELYLDDLADKTHRGLTGQALAGYSAGGLPYGYTSVHDGQGFKRVIDEEQAQWVRYIFEQSANGHTPRAIANSLNRQRVPAPRGGTWAQSAIYGSKRGTGILGNSIYIGHQVWNRSKWIKDPLTGCRKRIERPESEWIITEDHALAIVDPATWNAVKARQKRVRSGSTPGKPAGRGPKYLFSGLLKCGLCGSNYIVAGAYSYGCSGRLSRGVAFCNNQTVSRSLVETVLLRDIKTELLSESAFKAFEAETRRMLKTSQPDPADARNALQQATRERDNIMKAILQGVVTISTKAALEETEAKVADAKARLAEIEAFKPTQILPRAREIYRSMVDNLSKIDDIPRAREQIRAILGGEVRLIPEGNVLVAEIKGGLAALSQVMMVAGAGFGHNLTTQTRRIPLIQAGAIVTARNPSGK